MWKFFWSFAFLISIFSETNSDIHSDEINCINNLSLTELLRIKKSLENLNCNSCDEPVVVDENVGAEIQNDKDNDSIESRVLPDVADLAALPLVGGFIKKFLFKNKTIVNEINNNGENYENNNNNNGVKSVERSYEHWDEKKPSTKIETIFQISITGLSFLAFGGYLLCMIVQAIKSKGTTYYHPVATAAAQTNGGPLKKIKVYKRQRRMAGINRSKVQLNSGKNRTLHVVSENRALPSPDEMYTILRSFAEGYVKLTTSAK